MKKILQSNAFLKLISIMGFLILLIYLLCIALSPMHKLNDLNRMVKADSIFSKNYQGLFNDPGLAFLIHEKSYKEALLEISDNDSINLVINMIDSTICLTINGVTIHKTIPGSIKLDPMFENLPHPIYTWLFSKPLMIYEEQATIVKEPIVVRQAPKDPEEAAINAYEPDTLIQNPAFLRMKLDHGIHLVFEQDNNPEWNDKKTRFFFRMQHWLPHFIDNLKSFFSFRKQNYTPSILIKMPVNDLREIYRALPTHARVVIYYL